MKKRIITVFTCIALVVTALSTSVGAFSYWYTLDTPNDYGAKKELTAETKEYTQVSVNTSDQKSVSLALYKYTLFGGYDWYGNDQTLTYGTDRRAWWYGDTTDNYKYTIRPATNAPSMTLSGYFQNY